MPYTALTMFLSTDQKERDSATAYRECDAGFLMWTGAGFYLKSLSSYRKFLMFCVPKLDIYMRFLISDEKYFVL